MRRELEQTLKDTFPQIFRDMWGDPKLTCMAWGCDTGEGWYKLIYELCTNIQRQLDENPEPDFKFEQVKQKFGYLTVYHSGTVNDSIYRLVDYAAEESVHICEQCGSEESVRMSSLGWIAPLCKTCRQLTKHLGR